MLLSPGYPSLKTIQQDRRRNLIGSSWALAAVFLFSLVFISGKLTNGSIPAIQVLWFRYLGGFITVLITVVVQKQRLSDLRSLQPKVHAIRSLAGGAGTAAGIFAVMHMPVAAASAIGLTDGILTIFLAVLFLQERLTIGQWTASLMCLVAAIFVVTDGGTLKMGVRLDPVIVAIAVCGALSLAIENILIKLIAQSEPPTRVLLYVNFFGTLIFFVPALVWGSWTNIWVMTALLSLGPIATLGQYCNIRAYQIVDASLVASMRYSWIIFAAVLGFLFFNEHPSPVFYLGAIAIIASGFWLARSR